MKQKIVIRIQTECEKCRKKAMMVAAQTSGVNSVELLQAGESKNQMVVIGEGIDVAALARSVRNKTKNNASLEIVQQL